MSSKQKSGIDPNILSGINLFKMFDEQDRAALAQHLNTIDLLAGQTLFSAGDEGGEMYVVQQGKIELYLRDEADDIVSLGLVNTGELFGELSLLDEQPRSASAKAVENTRLIEIDREDLGILVRTHPDAALDMITALGMRLRQTNDVLRERIVRNVNDEIAPSATLGERLSDFLTALAGDIRFVYFSIIWFFVWIVLNLNIIPGVEAFDPFPFGLLTMVVSLEAIFLSLFVLISQNRQATREKVRNDIEYAVNLKAEVEIRELSKQIEQLQRLMMQNLSNLHLEVRDISQSPTQSKTSISNPAERTEPE